MGNPVKKKKAKKKSAKRTPKPKAAPAPDVPKIPKGAIVRFYDEGTRHGEVIKTTAHVAIVHPFGPSPRNIRIPLDQVQVVDKHGVPVEQGQDERGN